jgi:hypothetical protein
LDAGIILPDSTIPVSRRLRENESHMKTRFWIVSLAAIVFFVGIAFAVHHFGSSDSNSARESALALLPSDTNAVVFVEFAQLRNSPFIAALRDWAPQPQQPDAEYAKFLHDTGFDYERDLDRIAVASTKRGSQNIFFAVGDGRFDRKKINTYVSQYGTHASIGGREIFTIPVNTAPAGGSPRKISFAFLHQNRIVLTDDTDLPSVLKKPMEGEDARQWRARFDRLAGSPIFATLRQDAGAGSQLSSHAPGGMQSQQLASLLDQLLWITIAGQPENDRLRVVAEGECPTDATSHELADVLNAIRMFAQAGLNGQQVRQQLDPQTREAYIEVLKSADITRIDRGDTKAVRLLLEITPKFLAAARSTQPATPSPSTPAPQPAPAKSKRK